MSPRPRPVAERLYPRLEPCADPACNCDGCLLWPGNRNLKGYGQIKVNGRQRKVHRVAWELENGPVPDGLVIDHVKDRGCRHRNCANVAHLEPVTNRENLLRGHFSGRGRNAGKTHCDQGHEFTEANTYVIPSTGHRACRTCRRDWDSDRRERNRRTAA
jgi:hypothetical protein